MTESEFATRSPDSLYCCKEKRHVYYFQLSILILHFPLSLLDNDELSLLREGGGRRKLMGWCEGRMVWQPQNWKLREWGWLGQLKSLYLWLVKMWQDLRSQNRRQWVHCSVGLRPKCSSSPFVSLASWTPLDGVVLIPGANCLRWENGEEFAWERAGLDPSVCSIFTCFFNFWDRLSETLNPEAADGHDVLFPLKKRAVWFNTVWVLLKKLLISLCSLNVFFVGRSLKELNSRSYFFETL